MLEADAKKHLESLGLDDLPAAEDLLAREEAHVAADRAAGRPARRPRRQGAARDVARPARRRRPRDRAEDQRARGARSDRQGASRPRAARGRGARPRRPRSRAPATTRPTPGPGSSRTPSMPSRSPRRPSGSRSWREQLAALQRRHRVYAATLAGDRRRRARDDEDRHPLPREAHGRRPRGRHRRPLSPGPGRRPHARHRGPWRPRRATGSRSRALSQGTLDLVYLTARLGLVRLVTGDRRPPLLMDDPFVTLDDARAARALAAAQVGRRPTSRSST